MLFFSAMEIKKIDQSPQTTEFTFENLDLGLASTWANTFRRFLLTQVPGLAIFAVKMSDREKTIACEVGNENKLKGTREIPIYLILHLKELAFQFPKDELPQPKKVYTLYINIDNSQGKEEYVVTGQDIQGELTVVNPETYLATVAPASQLKITLYCRYYYASQLANSKEQKAFLPQAENLIFLDCDYCPVKNVKWKIEEVVIDLNKKKEKLVLTITTNGSISPQDSLLSVVNFSEQTMLNIQQQLAPRKKIEND